MQMMSISVFLLVCFLSFHTLDILFSLFPEFSRSYAPTQPGSGNIVFPNGVLHSVWAGTCLDLDPELHPGQGNSHADKHDDSAAHHSTCPDLGDEILATHGINDGAGSRRTRQRRKRRKRLNHAESGAHLARVASQTGQRRHKGRLVGADDDAVKDAKGVHAGARGDCGPAEEEDADARGGADEDVDGAEEAVGQIAGEGSKGNAHAVCNEEEVYGFDGREAYNVAGVAIDLFTAP